MYKGCLFRYAKGIIAGLLTIFFATGIAYGSLTMTKPNDMVIVKTPSIDIILGTPVVVNSKPLLPGDVLTVKIPVTNKNHFPVTVRSVQVEDIKWYNSDGATPVNLSSVELKVDSNTFTQNKGNKINFLAGRTTQDLQVFLHYPKDLGADYLDRTFRFDLNLTFNKFNNNTNENS